MEEAVDSIPIYEETEEYKDFSSHHSNKEKLDTEIDKIESELAELNRTYKPRSQTAHYLNEAPVFRVSLYSPTMKDKGEVKFEASFSEYLRQDPWERYERLEQARRSNLYKSVAYAGQMMEQRKQRPQSKPRQTDPLLFIDVTLAPDLVIHLPVSKTDTPAFLAEECFTLANIIAPKMLIDKLSRIIEAKIGEEIHNLIAAVRDRQQSFLREKLNREQQMKELARDRMKEFNLWTNKRPMERESKRKVLGKLSVIIGKNRTGEIVIREGDDPVTLVNNFITTFSLSRDHAQYFLDTIEDLIANATHEHAPTIVMPPEPVNEVLFRVQFNMEEGRKLYLDIRKNDNLYQVAQQFVVDNELDMERVDAVWEYIQSLYKHHVRSTV